ncbi:energy-coupling factor ABC transporter substrate-binding protein [Streptomyces sp. SLBN-115]|uniref:energy-coupling factor ABC transporter substrate-binding protein n=1 Tax=Streptomyces sp. SLBN-115 TaxID=2768453 RepID=UPI001153A750|nr:energy-coupling factor ABC transporter substrate-binding protein [Streptomyces sp. SLBN-115]TQJ47438.1 cobalt/nickel transport protein [Streptomyces sp. SLBN-115]
MSRNAKINTLLLFVVAALAVLPLALGLGDHKEEPFTGADSEAETAITEIRPDYEPWFSPLYEPPSGEIESALFALQAALGAGVLAYYFGLHRGRRQGELRALAQRDTTTSTTSAAARPSTTTRASQSTENRENAGSTGNTGSTGRSHPSGSASEASAPERT